jgi:hypothetical protein
LRVPIAMPAMYKSSLWTRQDFFAHESRLSPRAAKPYQVGVQTPRGVYPEVPTQGAVREIEAVPGREVFRKLAEQKESRIEEGHLPEYAVSQVIGFIKVKSAIHLARVYGERKRNFCWTAFLGEGVLGVDGGTR